MNTSRSAALHARAVAVTPGGVHSPVRAFGKVGGTPLFIRSAAGSRIEDVDGNRYVDFCMAFGPLILGHAHPAVLAAVTAAAARGWSYGTSEPYSLELAELVTGRLPWAERIRFVNSGTEAVMTALRLARAATGRSRILKFDGCYHGHTDAMLIRAGSGLAGEAIADSAGIPEGVAADTLVATLDDEQTLQLIFDRHGDDIAAVIIEPLPANFGLLPQRREFLEAVARLCRRHGTVLIFDEVISGFRLGFGGMSEHSGIRPDLVTWGKIIGGGFPVGAVAGRREIMELLAPAGPVYQAGTLSANPVAMSAGLATLHELADGTVYAALEERGRLLEQSLAGIPGLHVQRAGSIFWIVPGAEPAAGEVIRSPGKVPGNLEAPYAALFHHLLAAGIYLPPSPFEVGFLSAAHGGEDIQALAAACATR